ncbi:MAG TPA: alpha-L-arabinofuranosidase C-terminal domain-containing protein [Opitutaceae bacterium]|nr:alpha-L-arabinofuranosidase C-terminal domain-containing protein [Opitutaceae bacterium]
MKFRSTSLFAAVTLTAVCARTFAADANPIVLQVDASKIVTPISPTLYGLMTEEINYSYDGGLYAETIRNRSFQDDPNVPLHWSLVQSRGAIGAMGLDRDQPLNDALPVSLRVDIAAAPADGRVGVANDGYWGIPIKPNTRYRASFYAKAAPGFAAPVTLTLESADGGHVFAEARVTGISGSWRRFSTVLQTGDVPETSAARFVISTRGAGTLWFDLVSVFPPTWNNRPNGNRVDLIQLLADMHPSFLRFPGGNYLQGRTLASRFPWKHTLGDLADRPGHWDDWGYRSTDGMGLLEFLEWCEDLHMQPVLGVFAGFTLRGVATKAGPDLQPFVDDALEEIEYVTGAPSTRWGAVRAKDGHPAPFKLTYVEIGNEDFFDRVPGSYDARFAQFHDAIKAKYPELQLIATMKVSSRTPDVIDEHYYPSRPEVFESEASRYDSYDRKGPKVFVGEWATRIGIPTPNLLAAVSDAAWMTGMERNSDIVVMHSYAPLFVNVSDLTPKTGSMQWRTNLIGYDALHSYGSPSYYAQQMFSTHRGDVVLATHLENNPTRTWQPPRRRGARADEPPPPAKEIPAVFCDATRESATGTVYLKLVNTVATPENVRVELSGVAGVDPRGAAIVLTSAAPDDTNSITEPRKVVPVTTDLTDLSPTFTRELAPYSVTVLVLKTR